MISEALTALIEISPVGIALCALWLLPDWLQKWVALREAWIVSHRDSGDVACSADGSDGRDASA